MRVLYEQQADAQGRRRIHYAIYESDWFKYSHIPAQNSFDVLEIDEIADNAALCRDLAKTLRKADAEGENKYYVDAGGAIIEKDGWEEAFEDV